MGLYPSAWVRMARVYVPVNIVGLGGEVSNLHEEEVSEKWCQTLLSPKPLAALNIWSP